MALTEQQLYTWCRTQRNRNTQGKIEPRCKKLLENIPGWTWEPYVDKWDRFYSLTKKYKVVEARFITPDGVKLGKWQANMRFSYKKREAGETGSGVCVITPERIKRLEAIPGWTWEMRVGTPHKAKRKRA